MADIDVFATILLEEAKRFLERASDSSGPEGETANLHAAVMLGFCALEAHVNAIVDELAGTAGLSVHEKAFLMEREVRMKDGEFLVGDVLRITRLEERIQFLHRHFSGAPLDRLAAWWSELINASKLRNALTHPKEAASISRDAVKRALQAIIDTLSALFQAVYKEKFPAAGRGLQSKLNF